MNQVLNKLYDKIEVLENKKIAYLEVDDKASARRIAKQIEKIELEIKLSKFNKLKQELEVYKNVVKNYPSLQLEIKNQLLSRKDEKWID